MVEHQLLTQEEVANRLRVSRSTIHRMRQNPAFPKPFKITSRILRYHAAEIDDFLQRNRIEQKGDEIETDTDA